MITLRGPNIKPKALTIDEIPADVKDKLTINVQGEAGLENLITRLRRIEYIRKPNQLENDIQNTVDKTVGQEIPFIVFRKNDIKVTKDFELATISQGGIKIIEKE
jgi:predicted metalloendopeptidase